MEEQPVETTLYSLSEIPPAPANRRDGERLLTLYRVGTIMLGERRELCLIKNISAGGMMIRAYGSVPLDARVAVELKSGQMIAGSVSWVRDQTVGIAFDATIDLIDILSHSMQGPRPRMPRVEVDCYAAVRDGATALRMHVCDISQGGIKVETAALMASGSDVVASLPGLAPQPGVVRWVDRGFAGITFNRLLPLQELVGWLHDQRVALKATG